MSVNLANHGRPASYRLSCPALQE